MIRDLIVIAVGYLFGSIPTGLWMGHLVKGVDVRTVGSHRTGATNVQRSLGTPAGLLVLLLDFVKGSVPVAAVLLVTGNSYLAALAGIAAVVGHIWPVFAGFRGGRGVATAGGVLAPLVPVALLLTFLSFAVIVAITRYVSLGSIIGGALISLLVVLLRGHGFPEDDAAIMLALAVGSLVVVRHSDNLHRLLHGKESKLGQKAP